MPQLYYKDGDRIAGPVSKEELQYLKSIGRLDAKTLVRYGSHGDWVPLARSPRQNTGEPPAPSTDRTPKASGSKPSKAVPHEKTTQEPTPGIPPNSNPPYVPADNDSGTEKLKHHLIIAAIAGLLLVVLFVLLKDDLTTSLAGVGGGIASTNGNLQGETQGSQSSKSPTASDGADTTMTSDVAPTDVASNKATETTDSESLSDSGTESSESDVGEKVAGVVAGDPMSRFTISAPGEATFFGVTATGSHFGFVVDNSYSMLGAPLDRAKRELLNTISQLPDDAKVRVVFFSSTAYADPAGTRTLNPESRRALVAWIESIGTAGGTSPVSGIAEVFRSAPNPDVVFLLTDGGFAYSEVGTIKSLNTRDAQINTVSLISQSGASLLQSIAAQNAGDYRHVP